MILHETSMLNDLYEQACELKMGRDENG